MPIYGPCSGWDPIQCVAFPTGTEAVSGYAMTSAQQILYAESGRVFGLCERTVRPCRRNCGAVAGFGIGNWWEWSPGIPFASWPQPYLYAGEWFNLTCGGCRGSTCSCVEISEAWLPGPVFAVTRVLLNGVVMATGSYRVDQDQLLIRTDGGLWPQCQDMTQADDGADAWSVTAQFGLEVPISGRMAVGELALEIAKACVGEDCRLPQNIQTMARNGITIQLTDPNDFAERLYLCGLFIHAFNPLRRRSRSRAYDVENMGPRRTSTAGY